MALAALVSGDICESLEPCKLSHKSMHHKF